MSFGGGGWRGLLVVMERPEEEKVDGWSKGGEVGGEGWREEEEKEEEEEGRREGGGADDKRKIQTGQSFPFANRAPDKDSACSGADRGAISLPYSPPPPLLHPSASLARQLVCEEERKGKKRKKEKKRRALSVLHHGATINQPPRSN